MPKTTSKKTINTAEFGRKYYDVLDVYTQKIMTKIIENSRELNIDKDAIKSINNILIEETSHVKNWGFDHLIKTIRE